MGFDRALPARTSSNMSFSRDPFPLPREDYISERMRLVLCDVIESRSGFCVVAELSSQSRFEETVFSFGEYSLHIFRGR